MVLIKIEQNLAFINQRERERERERESDFDKNQRINEDKKVGIQLNLVLEER